jgi:hypothetical protein
VIGEVDALMGHRFYPLPDGAGRSHEARKCRYGQPGNAGSKDTEDGDHAGQVIPP